MNGDCIELWRNGIMLAWLEERPQYCNRGRYHANINVTCAHISDCDPWPRYYFSLGVGIDEVMQWLRAHGVKLDGTEIRSNPIGTATGIDMDQLVRAADALQWVEKR